MGDGQGLGASEVQNVDRMGDKQGASARSRCNGEVQDIECMGDGQV